MLNPNGFESMSGLARKAREFSLTPDQFVTWVVGLKGFFLANPDNLRLRPIKCDPIVIQFLDGAPVFFDADTWALSLERVRGASNSFDPRITEDLSTGQYLLIPEGDVSFHHLSQTELDFLSKFEGYLLVVDEVAADTLTIFANNLTNKSQTKAFTLTKDREAAYDNWLNTIPGRNPTVEQRDEWRNGHSVNRAHEREMWLKYKPEGGSRPGVKPKNK